MNLFKAIIYGAALAVVATACSDSNRWNLKGEITGAADKDVIVEYQSFVGWQGIDTVKADKRGCFTVSRESKGYPEIFRVRIDDHIIYFPIDSVETVTISGTLSDLGNTWTMSGSTDADMLMRVEKRIAEAGKMSMEGIEADSLLKRDLTSILLENPKSITSYYIINRSIGGQPLFRIDNPRDLRVIGAVANAFQEMRPNDPRTSRLVEAYMQGRVAAGLSKGKSIEVEAIGLQDISLYDVKGVQHRLSDVARMNKVVVLNFTAYGAEASPMFNRVLNEMYTRYHAQGVEIYQVAIDEDELSWRNAAENLPWIAVRNAGSESTQNLLRYNVNTLPTTYVIVDGEIAERVSDIEQLGSAVGRHIS